MDKIKLRTLIIFLIFTGIFCIWDLKNELKIFYQTKKHGLFLQQQLSQAKNTANQSNDNLAKLTSEAYVLTELLNLAQETGVRVDSIHEDNKILSENESIINLTAFADFVTLKKFLLALFMSRHPCYIQQANIISLNRSLKIVLRLVISNWQFAKLQVSVHESVTNIWDPFNTFLTNQSDDFALLKEISLTQIRYVGYVKYHSTIHAVVMLPNKKSLLVSVGDYLGKERGEIQKIDPTCIWIKSARKTVLKYHVGVT